MADIKALLEVGGVMAWLPAPWFVAGGWAIDCFLARITREHRDVDILVFRRDFASVAKAIDSESRQWLRQALLLTAPNHERLRTL